MIGKHVLTLRKDHVCLVQEVQLPLERVIGMLMGKQTMALLHPQTATNHHELGFLIMRVLLVHMNLHEVQFEEMVVLAEMRMHLLAVQG